MSEKLITNLISSLSKEPLSYETLTSVFKKDTLLEDTNAQIKKILGSLSQTHKEVLRPEYTVETKSFQELTQVEIEKIIHNFREDFGSLPWGEYKKCSAPCCQHKVSIQEYYGLDKNEYIALSTLEEIDRILPQDPKKHACKSHSDAPLINYWDTKNVEEDLKSKFEEDGHISLLKDQNNQVVGYTWGYASSFQKAYEHEYAKFYEDHTELIEKYMSGVSEALEREFTMESPVYVWNMIGILKEHRTMKNRQQLCQSFLNNIPEKYADLPIPGESNRTIESYNTMKVAGALDICNSFIEDCVLMLYAKKASDMQKVFCISEEEYIQKYGAMYRYQKELQRIYISQKKQQNEKPNIEVEA